MSLPCQRSSESLTSWALILQWEFFLLTKCLKRHGKETGMRYIIAERVSPGSSVWTGFLDQFLKAPTRAGSYRLVQLADEKNQHVRFVWEAE